MSSTSDSDAVVFHDRVPYPTFIGIIWMGIGICVVFFTLRICIRIVCFRKMLPEDYLMLTSVFTLIGFAVMAQCHLADIYWLTHTRRALNIGIIPQDVIQNGIEASLLRAEGPIKTEGVSLVLFIVGLDIIKLNFLVFFYRIGRSLQEHLILWWIAFAIVLGCGFVGIGIIPYQCLFKDAQTVLEHCAGTGQYVVYEGNVNRASVAIDVISDGVVIIIPVAILWKARISMRQKITLSAVFCLVGCTIAATIVRGMTFNDTDTTWAMFFFFIEYTVAFMIACIISFRTLWVSHVRGKMEREMRRAPSLPQPRRGVRGHLRNWYDSVINTFHDLEGTTLERNDVEMPRLPMPASGLMTVDFSEGDTGWGEKRRGSEHDQWSAAKRPASPASPKTATLTREEVMPTSPGSPRAARLAGAERGEHDDNGLATREMAGMERGTRLESERLGPDWGSPPQTRAEADGGSAWRCANRLINFSRGGTAWTSPPRRRMDPYAVDNDIRQGDFVRGGIYSPAYGAREPAAAAGTPGSLDGQQPIAREAPREFEGEVMVIPQRLSFIRRGSLP